LEKKECCLPDAPQSLRAKTPSTTRGLDLVLVSFVLGVLPFTYMSPFRSNVSGSIIGACFVIFIENLDRLKEGQQFSPLVVVLFWLDP
jgi:hypothetical protein